ncbi:BAD_HP_G0039660.mRNA.1.CDS.1 [Saccharomyces cerevisiae]|nr:BAD_HP_G0034120.mRNA.1.CDS.1 [Saccharomyces cerevisiae]CAI4964506.1 BAD_HP_G0039660.mRNA.1.CDS.1 [Saccharomyces cerevisiae]CAI6656382.1 BAD_HP_G0034120.mRNA.1.CDS.1 [Saccharomyces cerevisiae]CAI6708155.1 BAD_HP_G0039660.mRNA.1.CDS.1 [Saccharomyces cerevisiae]
MIFGSRERRRQRFDLVIQVSIWAARKVTKHRRKSFFVDSKEYAFHGGAVLIQSERSDYPYACLTISGLKQEEDHLMAVSSLIAFANESLEEDLNLD